MAPAAATLMLPSPGKSSAAIPSPRLPQDFLSGQSRGRQGAVPQPPALAPLQEAPWEHGVGWGKVGGVTGGAAR